MIPSEQKAEIRRQTLGKRDAMSIEERIEKSLIAADLALEPLIQTFDITPGSVVSGYFPIRSEFDVRPLLDELRKAHARLCLPVVMDKETILFRELLRTNELVDTGFGTRGPPESADVLDPSILLMPLAAFDNDGNRIGYGAGHYDRAIAKLEKKNIVPKLIGVAFECQRTQSVPAEPHDRPLHAVITEQGFQILNSGKE